MPHTPQFSHPPAPRRGPSHGSPREVLFAFLKLGLISFGGPVAHLGYFRTELVERRRWLDDQRYAELVALCQFLPGPASSQVGMALGLARAGWWGALAAWVGFTLPSALALILWAHGLTRWQGLVSAGVLHGLKLVAVAVVAQALWGMARVLCPDRSRQGMALATALGVVLLPSVWSPLLAMALAGLLARWWVRLPPAMASEHTAWPVSRRTGVMLLTVFLVLLLGLPLAASLAPSVLLASVSQFYQAGALVLGGGHVVLPLLQAGVVPPGWVSQDLFLAGYGAAQAVPGPLFTFAAFLGAVMPAPLGGLVGGLVLLLAIFLPSVLLLGGALPFWERWRHQQALQRSMAGMQAAVVGVLAAALYDPVCTGAIHSWADLVMVLPAFGLLVWGRISPVLVVALMALAGALLAA